MLVAVDESIMLPSSRPGISPLLRALANDIGAMRRARMLEAAVCSVCKVIGDKAKVGLGRVLAESTLKHFKAADSAASEILSIVLTFGGNVP